MDQGEKLFLFWPHFSDRYSSLRLLLNNTGWTVKVCDANHESLESYIGSKHKTRKQCLLFITHLDTYKLMLGHVEELENYLSSNDDNSLFVCCGADARSSNRRLLNQLIKKFGVQFNLDCVLRPNPYALYHPKEARLEDFVANRSLSNCMGKFPNDTKLKLNTDLDALPLTTDAELPPAVDQPSVLYPEGCTINVNTSKSIIMMTSSKWTVPSEQAICALHRNDNSKSRLVALGSTRMLCNEYLQLECNEALIRSLLNFIQDRNLPINISDAKTLEIPPSNMTADMSRLVDVPLYRLQEFEYLPENKSELFDRQLFRIDTAHLPEVLRAYKDLDMPNRRLTLIKPRLDLSFSKSID